MTCNFDVVIWCGDLNFRLAEDRAAVMHRLANAFNTSRSSPTVETTPESSSLLRADQLAAVLAAETILKGFQEAPIRFPPTYKVSYLYLRVNYYLLHFINNNFHILV